MQGLKPAEAGLGFTSSILKVDYSATIAGHQDRLPSLQRATVRDHQRDVGGSYTGCSSSPDFYCSSRGARYFHSDQRSEYALHDSG
ncbi:hypothetical protein I7V30_14375 [Lelliottia amnigena]|uniref:hypothetical protein n=1 Tax=Lelliottia amnigena TaxID=61646 RepID=UPI00192C756F|nr:hypothetical protein [Lelliottia amnigena]MBL5966441.1 hypothetical protein [Lelliottia amnigena]